ncbi:sulfatase-like hydrolase/transferase [Paenibacillus sp. MABNR03]|uniref:sulfatase-like hydrolase/transferase n=1 Tax=Paenibacillus sp. MABNR03 TaxID=3142626 RepID=UPI003D26C6C8
MTAKVKRPHIILFNPDQWRGDVLGHLGNPAARTPNLDQFVAEDAVSFSRAFCQNPVCTPSRCSFMTGWYPHVRGHRTMYHLLKPDEPMLLQKLKEAGYFVWWGGKNDLIDPESGYDDYCDVKHVPPDSTARMFGPDWKRGEAHEDTFYSFYVGNIEKGDGEVHYPDSDWAHIYGAIDLIRDAPSDQPICIYLPILYPHPPYAVEEPWYSLINRSLLPPRVAEPSWGGKPSMLTGLRDKMQLHGWTEQRWDELRATYYGMCARVDKQFGLLVQALKDAGIYEDTAIFFFSDHGDFTGDYGLVEKTQNTFEDCLTRVPFIVKPPVGEPLRPGISDAMIELIDLCATVYDYADIDEGYTHFGRSLRGVIGGQLTEHRDAVFSEGGRLRDELHCNESTPFNEDRNSLYWPRGETQRSEGPEHTKATMIRTKRYKYVRRYDELDELYDLVLDPGETYNRINDPSLAQELLKLKERMLDFYQGTCDVVPHQRAQRE